jgi:hypothetical protein
MPEMGPRGDPRARSDQKGGRDGSVAFLDPLARGRCHGNNPVGTGHVM